MPERQMKSEALQLGKPLALGSVTLLPIERVVQHIELDRLGVRCWAAREACALVVRDGEGIRLIGLGAAAISLEALREQIPGLDGALAAM